MAEDLDELTKALAALLRILSESPLHINDATSGPAKKLRRCVD